MNNENEATPIAPISEQAHGAEQLDRLHDEITLPVKCTELGCERRFATPRALKMHGTLVHGWTPNANWAKYGAGKTRKAALEAKRAQRAALAAAATKFKCKHCGVVFAAKWRLASHVRIEHPRKPHGFTVAPAVGEIPPLARTMPAASYNYCKNCGVKL